MMINTVPTNKTNGIRAHSSEGSEEGDVENIAAGLSTGVSSSVGFGGGNTDAN